MKTRYRVDVPRKLKVSDIELLQNFSFPRLCVDRLQGTVTQHLASGKLQIPIFPELGRRTNSSSGLIRMTNMQQLHFPFLPSLVFVITDGYYQSVITKFFKFCRHTLVMSICPKTHLSHALLPFWSSSGNGSYKVPGIKYSVLLNCDYKMDPKFERMDGRGGRETDDLWHMAYWKNIGSLLLSQVVRISEQTTWLMAGWERERERESFWSSRVT